MQRWLFFAVIASLLGSAVVSSGLGTVTGHVYAENEDRPVAAASVYLESLDRANPGRPSITKTDGDGKFSIEVQAGKYAIHAFKPEDGYADVWFAFELAPQQKLKEVEISEGQHLDGLDVRLGPKPAVLQFTVTDAQTGTVLPSVDYDLCQVQHPDWCLRGGAPGKTEFSAPAATEITIQVGSDGHKSIRYVEKGKSFISLTPGEHKEVSVALPRIP